MKRQVNTFVVPTNGTDWSQGWTIYADTSNGGATYNAATDVLVNQQLALPSNISVVNDLTQVSGTTHYVMFSGAGFAVNVSTGNPAVIGQSLDFQQNVSGEQRRVILNTAGRLRVCTPPPADASCSSAADL